MAVRQLAAQLGYAWRRARKPGGFYHKAEPATAASIVADLHAEALARLGSELRPLATAPMEVQLARADPLVREALRHLEQLASPTAATPSAAKDHFAENIKDTSGTDQGGRQPDEERHWEANPGPPTREETKGGDD